MVDNNKITRRNLLKSSLNVSILSMSSVSGSSLFKHLIKMSDGDFIMDDNIKEAYEIGLKLLNPSKSELEHGLELHKNSIVFDSYGFIPRASVDGTKIAALINDNASKLEIDNISEDMAQTRMVEDKREREEFKNAWNASGVTCVFQNSAMSGNEVYRMIKRIAHFTYLTDMMSDYVFKAVKPDDILFAKKNNRKSIYLTGNGVPLAQEWVSVEEELRYIKIFYELGMRMLHLTYNRRNVIGDGCAEPANAGLSDFGRTVVKEMNRVGIVVDIAHSGWQTSYDAAKYSNKPMVASHTTVASLNKVVRAKPDNVIKAIADTGGYIGICCIPKFLGGSGDINSFIKHIDYVVKKFGPEHVAIGTDIAYNSRFGTEENEIKKRLLKKQPPVGRSKFLTLWPDEPFDTTQEMIKSMQWTNWPLFTVGLVKLGYSDLDIQKIIGGNVIRVCNDALV